MFNNHEMTRAFIAERQEAIRNEISTDRLARRTRRARRSTTEVRSVRPPAQIEPLPAVTRPLEERAAA